MSVLANSPFLPGKRFYIPEHIHAQMLELTRACSVEVSAVGLVSLEPEGVVVRELYVPHQLVGDAHAQVDGAMLSEAQAHWFNNGKIVVGDTKTFVRFNWHSHVDFQAEFSIPDKQQSASMGGDGTAFDPPWWISMVMNRDGEYSVCLELFQPIRTTLDITDETMFGHHAHPSTILDLLERVKKGRREHGNKK